MAETQVTDPELEMLKANKESGYNYRERRQDQWTENYLLYRDKVIVNRLTQRQSVNIPLMKMFLRSLLKDVDDIPVIRFENLDNDKQKEIFQNEYWKVVGDQDHNKFSLMDIVDKRQVFHYGRSFIQWQIVNGMIKATVQDPQDILVSRFMDPIDLNTSRFLTHTHIFVPLSSLKNNPDYDQQAVAEMEQFYASEMGIVKAESNAQMMTEKNKKMEEMGVLDVAKPVLGETYVELSLNFVFRDHESRKGQVFDDQFFLYVDCDDMRILMKKPLEEVIGGTKDNWWQTHLPYDTWADDLEKQDFWSDGVADIIRTPNKVINSFYSQMVENRTLRNFGMHYFDTTAGDGTFQPQTFNPVPWGWYGVPGKPQDVLQKIEIPDLSESLDEMNFIIETTEKATGATPTQQGAQTERQITLGEVQLALGEAKERIKGMSKFYVPVWQERGTMFLKLIEAAPNKLDAVKIYKKGRNTDDIFTKEISSSDWMTESGYRVRIWSQDEKDTHDTQGLQKMNAAIATMPGNPKLLETYQRKLLEWADLPPDDVNEIIEFEKQKLLAPPIPGAIPGAGPQPAGSAPPVQPVM
jgi:hypothetical protein